VHGGGDPGYPIEPQSGGAKQRFKLACCPFVSWEENEHIQVGERRCAWFPALRHDPFDENNASVRSEGAGAVAEDFDALLVIPVMNNGFEDVEVSFNLSRA
jgi:hypothetical protein